MKLMNVMEPITRENLDELRPGEWIWDAKRIPKPAHKQMLKYERIFEPVGFRQIHILKLDEFKKGYSKLFMLTDIAHGHCVWMDFEEDRFFKFKWEVLSKLSADMSKPTGSGFSAYADKERRPKEL